MILISKAFCGGRQIRFWHYFSAGSRSASPLCAMVWAVYWRVLVPFALSFNPDPKIAGLVAICASLGTPFIISTPIYAMVHGEAGGPSRDFSRARFFQTSPDVLS